VITFSGVASSSTIQLTSSNVSSAAAKYGATAFYVNGASGTNITIDGSGAPGLVIDGGNAVRLFAVAGGNTLTLENLTLKHGLALGGAGGGSFKGGSGGGGAGLGGAVFDDGGSFTALDCTFTNNVAQGRQGGSFVNNGNTNGGGGGGGLGADQVCEGVRRRGGVVRQRRQATNHPAAALLPGFVAPQVDSFLAREQEQHLPEVVAIFQTGKAAAADPLMKAVETAQGHVLLVGDADRPGAQTLARQLDQLGEVAFPELGRGVAVAGLEVADPHTY
jgi:hypothetical protein